MVLIFNGTPLKKAVAMSKPFTIELDAFLKQIEALPVTKLYRLDAVLSDLSNHIHAIGEYISELGGNHR